MPDMEERSSNLPRYGLKESGDETVEDDIQLKGATHRNVLHNEQDDIFSTSSEANRSTDGTQSLVAHVPENQNEGHSGLTGNVPDNECPRAFQDTSSEQPEKVRSQISLVLKSHRNGHQCSTLLHSKSSASCLNRTNMQGTNAEVNGQNLKTYDSDPTFTSGTSHSRQCDCNILANESCDSFSEQHHVNFGDHEYFLSQTSFDVLSMDKTPTIVHVQSLQDSVGMDANKALSSDLVVKEYNRDSTKRSFNFMTHKPFEKSDVRTTNIGIGAKSVGSQSHFAPTKHINVPRSSKTTTRSDLNSSLVMTDHDRTSNEIETMSEVSNSGAEYSDCPHSNTEENQNSIQQAKGVSDVADPLGSEADSRIKNTLDDKSKRNVLSYTDFNLAIKNTFLSRPSQLNLAASNTSHIQISKYKTNGFLEIRKNSLSPFVNKSDETSSISKENETILSKASTSCSRTEESELSQLARAHRKYNQRSKISISKKELSMIKTLFVVFVCLSIFMSPYMVTILMDTKNEWSSLVHCACSYLAVVNNAINWMLYGLMNKSFRVGYRKVLTSISKKTCKKSSDQSNA